MRRLWHQNRWWVGRLIAVPFHLLLFIIVTFALIRLIPGDPVIALLGPSYTPEQYEAMQRAIGLDGTIWDQLVRYIGGLLQLDLGTSLVSGRPVTDQLGTRFPATLELTLQSVGLAVTLSVLLSYIAVVRPTGLVSRITRGFAQTSGAIPDYVLAIAGIIFFYALLHWIPAPLGRLDPSLSTPDPITNMPMLDALLGGRPDAVASIAEHTVLPVLAMAIGQTPLMIRLLLSGFDEAVKSAPVRFKVAAGAGHTHVVLSIIRRAAPPALIMCGGIFGATLGGTVILERMFGFTGLGTYAINAVAAGDYTAMQGVLMLIAAVSLLMYLVIDLLNMIIDPRRRPGARVEE